MIANNQESPEQTQYSDSKNLDARIRLHVQYSTNHYGWTNWVFDHFNFKDNSKILELGCGNGQLWKSNLHRVNKNWDVTLSDFSEGMLNDARNNLNSLDYDFKFSVIDVQEIPFDDAGFDVVIANHMLYHVPEKRKALAEIHRVLKNKGTLYATTVGEAHLSELIAILQKFDKSIRFGIEITKEFSLETGPVQMGGYFTNINVQRYIDFFEVPEAQPLVEYVLSSKGIGNVTEVITGEKVQEFRQYIEEIIQHQGMVRITKDSGVITACK